MNITTSGKQQPAIANALKRARPSFGCQQEEEESIGHGNRPRSRKRKQQSSDNSDPFSGIFTRSKEQIYLHRHRSGYARADSVRNRHLIQSRIAAASDKPVVVSQKLSNVVAVDHVLPVKDLRARRVFSPSTVSDEVVSVGMVDLGADLDVQKMISVSDDAVCGDLGVLDSVVDDLRAGSENVADGSSIREDDVMEGDEFVQMTPITLPDADLSKEVGGKDDMVSVPNEIVDAKGSVSKSQYPATSSRGRRRVFKSPSSFSFRRLLPYLKDLGKDDSSSFEIVEATLPETVQKSSKMSPNKAVCKDHEIGTESSCSVSADGVSTNVKSSEKQYASSVNPILIGNGEGSGSPEVVQKSHEGALNQVLEECEQTTPPDSDIYSNPKIDKSLDVLVKPTDTGTASNCSNDSNDSISASKQDSDLDMELSLIADFFMRVSYTLLGASKANQSIKLEKAIEQKQQQMFSCQRVSMEDSKTNASSEQPTTSDEKSDSPTSTLIAVDASYDVTNTVALVSSENVFGTDGTDMKCSRSTSQLEVKLQAEAVKFDRSVKLEQELPKNNLECVEEPTSKAISLCSTTRLEILPSINTEQSIVTTNDFMGTRNSYNEDKQKAVNEGTHQSSMQIVSLSSPGIEGETFKNGILKRTPRGCRGTCNCLNCTSFRLHAERSFEFSRNQMHDAEEVALELINDLAHLRNIIERTATDSNYLATLKEDQILVTLLRIVLEFGFMADIAILLKEVCEKSLYKEEVARARLAQMNEDLSIHCRSMKLLRPKVTFANKIEEKFHGFSGVLDAISSMTQLNQVCLQCNAFTGAIQISAQVTPWISHFMSQAGSIGFSSKVHIEIRVDTKCTFLSIHINLQHVRSFLHNLWIELLVPFAE
ncbi:hypothetical protein OSB04_010152 [Centaurea solstitialis]|uniref:Uncharacterized protein n=1 Tax=Centaurea solstitialis TaxID=347529 RepID=A0AA38T6Z5_9ASTR|nr:hypothetical protein OSB04_010152 [Centaurea solstitialis]